jgi:hypothetical protein
MLEPPLHISVALQIISTGLTSDHALYQQAVAVLSEALTARTPAEEANPYKKAARTGPHPVLAELDEAAARAAASLGDAGYGESVLTSVMAAWAAHKKDPSPANRYVLAREMYALRAKLTGTAIPHPSMAVRDMEIAFGECELERRRGAELAFWLDECLKRALLWLGDRAQRIRGVTDTRIEVPLAQVEQIMNEIDALLRTHLTPEHHDVLREARDEKLKDEQVTSDVSAWSIVEARANRAKATR